MKRTLIILIAVLVVIFLIVLGVRIFGSNGTSPTEPTSNFFGISTSTNQGSDIPVLLRLDDGSSVSVKNFVPKNQPEWANSTNGYQIGELSDAYSILYYPDASGFLISLLSEPIGSVRLMAEKELRSKMLLSDAQLCKLQVQVFTSVDVNEAYAGMNLGLSFCPGAVNLP